MMAVWLLTGLWHGAAWNFVLWGLYYGILLTLEKYIWGEKLKHLPSFFGHVYTIAIVVTGFVLFVFDDMQLLGSYLRSMLKISGNAWWGMEFFWFLSNYGLLLSAAFILALPVYPWLCQKYGQLGNRGKVLCSLASLIGYLGLFMLTTACLVNDSYNPFLYFRF